MDLDKPKKTTSVESSSDSEEENADEKRLRQGRVYLQKVMRTMEPEGSEDEEDEQMHLDRVSSKLAEDAVRSHSTLFRRSKSSLTTRTMPNVFYFCSYKPLEKCLTAKWQMRYVCPERMKRPQKLCSLLLIIMLILTPLHANVGYK